MKVVLAEFDKGLMLKRKKENYFLGICPKISWKDFKGGRNASKKYPGTI